MKNYFSLGKGAYRHCPIFEARSLLITFKTIYCLLLIIVCTFLKDNDNEILPTLLVNGSTRCDQMLDYKSFPNVFKSCLNNIHSWFYINWSFSKQPKCQQSFWATFESEFVAKSFQKSPNLVTLDGTLYSLTAWSSTTKNGLAYLVELVQRLLVLGGVSPPLPWQVDVDLGFDECQAVRDKANVSKALLHDHGRKVGTLRGVGGHFNTFQGDRVPFRFGQSEFSVRFLMENHSNCLMPIERGILKQRILTYFVWEVSLYGWSPVLRFLIQPIR